VTGQGAFCEYIREQAAEIFSRLVRLTALEVFKLRLLWANVGGTTGCRLRSSLFSGRAFYFLAEFLEVEDECN
jgi:hypothetical protein